MGFRKPFTVSVATNIDQVSPSMNVSVEFHMLIVPHYFGFVNRFRILIRTLRYDEQMVAMILP